MRSDTGFLRLWLPRALLALCACLFLAPLAAADVNSDYLTAISSGDVSRAAAMFELGADIENAKDTKGFNALTLAAIGNNEKMIELVIEECGLARLDEQNRDGSTALMAAAARGHINAMRLLLDRHVSLDTRDNEGKTALMLAQENGQKKAAKYLLARGAPVVVAAPAISTPAAAVPALFGNGPDLEAEEALRDAYIRFFELDPSDIISSETARYLRESTTTIALRELDSSSLATYGNDGISLNLGWLPLIFGSANSPSAASAFLQSYRKSLMNTWLESPEQLDSFVRRTAALIVHEAGHGIYERRLNGESFSEFKQDLQCRYREVLFMRRRVRSDPQYLDLKDYDALMREQMGEPKPAGEWWRDPLPEGLSERRAMNFDEQLRQRFPGRFDYSLEWAWYRMRLLDDGFPAFRTHMLAEVKGEYPDPSSEAKRNIAEIEEEIADAKRWLKNDSAHPDPDPWGRRVEEHFLDMDVGLLDIERWTAPSEAYTAFFELENTRLEGQLVQELFSYPPFPVWAEPAQGPAIKQPPPLSLSTILGAPVASISGWDSLRGNVVVLEFWATWCGPCKATIPHMNSLAKAFRGKAVRFLSVTQDPREMVEAFLKTTPLRSWVGLDEDGKVSQAFNVTGIPDAFLIDAKGNLIEEIDPRKLTPQMLDNVLAGKEPGSADVLDMYPVTAHYE